MAGKVSITGGGVFTSGNIKDINSNFSQLFAGFTPGQVIYCKPSSSYLGVQDGSYEKPYTDLVTAYNTARNGMNDIVLLIGNGSSNGSARISSAFTWSKDATHLIGVCAPGMISQRARIAPTSGATAFANFFTVSGNGCYFQNIQWFQGFDTGTTSQICMTVTGSRNVFQSCHIAGMGDAASAQSTGSRNLKIGSAGSGENLFVDCAIGIDTVARTVANASVEFAGATTRNIFRGCVFPIYATNAGVLGILGTGNGCVDRFNMFENCSFINSVKSGSGTAMTVLGSFTTAAPGGLVLLKNTVTVGMTDLGDTNFFANSYIDMAQPAASTGGLGVNPS